MKLSIKSITIPSTLLAVIMLVGGYSSAVQAEKVGFKEGATMVALVNLHPDTKRRVLYAMNYQLPSLIPMCTKVKIDDIGRKKIKLIHNGIKYSYVWDKHTKGAGQSLEENFKQYFGEKCDQKKVSSLSKTDKEGIKAGIPKVGMTKTGILFAMGRPPIHATSSLESSTWMYWSNKWVRKAVDFDDKGVVKQIR